MRLAHIIKASYRIYLQSPARNWPRRVSTMAAWVAESFEGELKLKEVQVPEISKPNQILLRVKASSVNPIDILLQRGYGDKIFKSLKQLNNCQFSTSSRLPLITGRDCSGVVEHVGNGVSCFKRGDQVVALIYPSEMGSHAQYAIVEEGSCIRKPGNLSYAESASFPYTACSAWAALVTIARLTPSNTSSNRILIHGGSGGVGCNAIQLLRAWKAQKVVSTCSEKSFDLIASLGGIPVDYESPSVKDDLVRHGPFDVILDCCASELCEWSDNVMGMWRFSAHVSLVTPVVSNLDRYGLPFGALYSAVQGFCRSLRPIRNGRLFTYAFFTPNKECLETFASLLESGKVKAIIDSTYSFDKLPSAFQKVSEGNTMGKVVISFESDDRITNRDESDRTTQRQK